MSPGFGEVVDLGDLGEVVSVIGCASAETASGG